MHNRLLSQNFVTLHSLMKEMEEFEPRKETDIQFRKALKAYVASFVQKNSASLSALQKVLNLDFYLVFCLLFAY